MTKGPFTDQELEVYYKMRHHKKPTLADVAIALKGRRSNVGWAPIAEDLSLIRLLILHSPDVILEDEIADARIQLLAIIRACPTTDVQFLNDVIELERTKQSCFAAWEAAK